MGENMGLAAYNRMRELEAKKRAEELAKKKQAVEIQREEPVVEKTVEKKRNTVTEKTSTRTTKR